MWLQTDKSCGNQRQCWSLAGWVTAHPMFNAHISIFLPPHDRANFLHLTPQPLSTTNSRVSDCWGCTGLILLLLYSAIYPDPRSDKHPIDTFPQQQSLSWRSCSHALTTCSDPSHLSPKDTSPCLDQEVGFCVHFLNSRLKARTFSITYSCHSSQGFVM